MTDNEFKPDWASPPGETIQDIIDERNECDSKLFYLAKKLGLELTQIDDLISGHILITDEMAKVLAEEFGGGTQFWVNREANYRETLARLGKKEDDEDS